MFNMRDDQIEKHLRSKKHMKNKNKKHVQQHNSRVDPDLPDDKKKKDDEDKGNPEILVSNSVQWRGPIPVFTAVAVFMIACILVTPVAVSMHVDGGCPLEQHQAQARLAERPTTKSKSSVLEIPARSGNFGRDGSSINKIFRAQADTQDLGLLQSSP